MVRILAVLAGVLPLGLPAMSLPPHNGPAAASPIILADSAPSPNACDEKLITQADIAPLLSEDISGEKTLEGDPQSCEFDTVGFSSVQIALRPGVGKMSIAIIASGKTNQTVTPLAGVGDEAVFDPALKEVDAEKNDLLCTIGVEGPAAGPATADKIGALCNKIFAAQPH